jgi:hypothetical protein
VPPGSLNVAPDPANTTVRPGVPSFVSKSVKEDTFAGLVTVNVQLPPSVAVKTVPADKSIVADVVTVPRATTVSAILTVVRVPVSVALATFVRLRESSTTVVPPTLIAIFAPLVNSA